MVLGLVLAIGSVGCAHPNDAMRASLGLSGYLQRTIQKNRAEPRVFQVGLQFRSLEKAQQFVEDAKRSGYSTDEIYSWSLFDYRLQLFVELIPTEQSVQDADAKINQLVIANEGRYLGIISRTGHIGDRLIK